MYSCLVSLQRPLFLHGKSAHVTPGQCFSLFIYELHFYGQIFSYKMVQRGTYKPIITIPYPMMKMRKVRKR